MQHLSKLNPINLYMLVLLLRLVVVYQRAYAFAGVLRSPVVIFRERRKAVQVYVRERRMNSYHWLGDTAYLYPERQKYIINIFGYKIHLWVSVDVSPT